MDSRTLYISHWVGQKSDTSRTYITLYERYHVFWPTLYNTQLICIPMRLVEILVAIFFLADYYTYCVRFASDRLR